MQCIVNWAHHGNRKNTTVLCVANRFSNHQTGCPCAIVQTLGAIDALLLPDWFLSSASSFAVDVFDPLVMELPPEVQYEFWNRNVFDWNLKNVKCERAQQQKCETHVGSHSPGGRTVTASRNSSTPANKWSRLFARYATSWNISSDIRVAMARPISWKLSWLPTGPNSINKNLSRKKNEKKKNLSEKIDVFNPAWKWCFHVLTLSGLGLQLNRPWSMLCSNVKMLTMFYLKIQLRQPKCCWLRLQVGFFS